MFKNLDVELVERTSKDDCRLIINDLESIINLNAIPFGSTCKSEWSGDIDVIIECENREVLWNTLCDNFSNVKKCGSLFSILYHHKPTGFVQVDLLPSRNPEEDAWCLSGGKPGGFKGRYRNILLSYLSKRMSEDAGFKITFASPGGLGRKGSRIIDPQSILDYLKIPCDPISATSIEGVVESLVKSNQAKRLAGFSEYVYNPKDRHYQQTKEVIKYINAILLDI